MNLEPVKIVLYFARCGVVMIGFSIRDGFMAQTSMSKQSTGLL